MAVNSKQKGARFERTLASKFREYGYDARRTAQYCGNTGDASDVVGLPGIHIEAKHQETMRLYEWISQAKRDAENGGKGNRIRFEGVNSMSKATQAERIRQYMEDFGSITQLEALNDLGCMRLASRISDLKKKGIPIKSEVIAVKNRYKEDCYIKRYSLGGEA